MQIYTDLSEALIQPNQVQFLDLSDQNLIKIPDDIFQLTNLTQLGLGNNQISEIPPKLCQLNNLTQLDLWGNQISVIPPEIGQMTNLTTLGLASNQISVIPPEIGQMTNLTTLGLGNNQLSEIPPEIGNLINLTNLNLSQNKLINLSSEINQLSKLQSLNLYQNRFQKFPQIVTQLPNLQQLHLDNNQIRSLPITIKNLIKLEHLWLSGNFIRQLPIELGQLTSLTELHLGRNRIYQVPSELGNLKNLVTLNLSQNHLTEIPSQILDLRQLETLGLEGNVRSQIVTDFGKSLTYRQQMEVALKQAENEQEVAENANRVKGQFLSQMSHELKTPMNGVIGSLNLISEDKLDTEERKHLQRARSSGQYLLTVIDEILQFSELEQGEITYQQQPFDLINTCQQVLQMILPLSQQKNLDLNLDYPFAISADWVGDQQKIKQVLVNLLGNAIKFTTEGEINLKLRPISTGIRIEVTDTGIGISEEQKETIFESFTQASQGTNRRFSGTGLGLTISQQFVQRMGGRIGVESQLGQGSIFWLELPWKRAELEEPKVREATGKIVASTDYTGRRVLVVDDELVNREIVGAYLKKWGFEVDQAVDGRDCLRQFEPDKYDLIVMDLQMPELDGFEASKEIRKLEQEVNQGRVSILALSASVMGEVWKKCESAGMNGYLSKPFETEELQQKVKQILTELDADIDQIKSGKVEGNN